VTMPSSVTVSGVRLTGCSPGTTSTGCGGGQLCQIKVGDAVCVRDIDLAASATQYFACTTPLTGTSIELSHMTDGMMLFMAEMEILGMPATPNPTVGSPPPGPTSSPTPHGLWTLEFQEMAATLASDVEDELTFTYLIGSGRDYETSFLEKGCDATAPVDDALYNVTNSTAFFNSTHQLLNVSYSLDKSALASSSIWNNDTSTIELCQVTSLFELVAEPVGKLIIVEDKREVGVSVDLGANFTIKTNLTRGEIGNETEELDFASTITAFKCSNDFSQNNDKLSPNNEMFTCIKSKDSAFEVENLDSMVISQTNKPDLRVIVGGKIQIPSITSSAYTTDGVIVGTRIPINLFDFVDGAFLAISGAVTIKLADGSSRRLNVDLSSIVRNLQDETNEASFTVDVALQTAEESSIQGLMSNSAAGVAATALKGFVITAFFLFL